MLFLINLIRIKKIKKTKLDDMDSRFNIEFNKLSEKKIINDSNFNDFNKIITNYFIDQLLQISHLNIKNSDIYKELIKRLNKYNNTTKVMEYDYQILFNIGDNPKQTQTDYITGKTIKLSTFFSNKYIFPFLKNQKDYFDSIEEINNKLNKSDCSSYEKTITQLQLDNKKIIKEIGNFKIKNNELLEEKKIKIMKLNK